MDMLGSRPRNYTPRGQQKGRHTVYIDEEIPGHDAFKAGPVFHGSGQKRKTLKPVHGYLFAAKYPDHAEAYAGLRTSMSEQGRNLIKKRGPYGGKLLKRHPIKSYKALPKDRNEPNYVHILDRKGMDNAFSHRQKLNDLGVSIQGTFHTAQKSRGGYHTQYPKSSVPLIKSEARKKIAVGTAIGATLVGVGGAYGYKHRKQIKEKTQHFYNSHIYHHGQKIRRGK